MAYQIGLHETDGLILGGADFPEHYEYYSDSSTEEEATSDSIHSQHATPEEAEKICTICWESVTLIEGSARVTCGKCQQQMHLRCAMGLRDVRCPVCRTDIFDRPPTQRSTERGNWRDILDGMRNLRTSSPPPVGAATHPGMQAPSPAPPSTFAPRPRQREAKGKGKGGGNDFVHPPSGLGKGKGKGQGPNIESSSDAEFSPPSAGKGQGKGNGGGNQTSSGERPSPHVGKGTGKGQASTEIPSSTTDSSLLALMNEATHDGEGPCHATREYMDLYNFRYGRGMTWRFCRTSMKAYRIDAPVDN